MRISDWSSDVCSSDLLVGVAAIDLAQRDHAQRRLAAGGEQVLHVAHLHAGRVCAQQASIAEVEGVVHRARRVVRREVQRLEVVPVVLDLRSEEHTSELQSLMRISYAVFCLKKKKTNILK